jgi:PAS domain S-box-containing protein
LYRIVDDVSEFDTALSGVGAYETLYDVSTKGWGMGRAGRSIRVLHVDDDPSFAETAAEFLERESDAIEVVTERDASAALDRLEVETVDCIVSDYEMPGRNGIEFLEAVRDRDQDLPFILYTGKGSEEVASDAISAGVTDYLQKERGTDQYALLANQIENAVERRAAERERKELEQRHREKANLLDQIFAQIPANLYLKDDESRHLRISETMLTEIDRDPEEVIGKTDVELYDADIAEESYADDRRVIETGEPIINKEEHLEADDQWILTSKVPWYGNDGEIRGLIGIGRDITDQKRLEREHRERSTLLEQIFEQVPIHLYVKDAEARHTHVSTWVANAAEESPDAAEQIGKTDRELYAPELARVSYADDLHVLETGEPVIDREEYDPDEEEYNLTSKAPLFDDDGEIQGLVGVTRQITERKEYEQRLERQNERLEEFVSIVSHDLRNPLNVATGQLELAREECDSERLDRVERAHDRMETLIADLLQLAREGDAAQDLEPVRLSTAVERSQETVETGDATVVIGADARLRADVGRLHQLLENLLANAVEHGGEDPEVRVGELPEDAGFYVADDGPGVPADRRDRVFDAGYSTSESGTGFGLSIVEEIAEAHDWEIRVTDSADGGARFEITGVDVESVD